MGADGGPVVLTGLDDEAAAKDARTLFQPAQAKGVIVVEEGGGKSQAVVFNGQFDLGGKPGKLDANRPGVGVLEDVVERFLDDLVQVDLVGRMEHAVDRVEVGIDDQVAAVGDAIPGRRSAGGRSFPGRRAGDRGWRCASDGRRRRPSAVRQSARREFDRCPRIGNLDPTQRFTAFGGGGNPFGRGFVPRVGELFPEPDGRVGTHSADNDPVDARKRCLFHPREMSRVDDGDPAVGGKPQPTIACAHAGGLHRAGQFQGAEAIGPTEERGVNAIHLTICHGMQFLPRNRVDAASAGHPQPAQTIVQYLENRGVRQAFGGRKVAEQAVVQPEQSAVQRADPEGAIRFGVEADDGLDRMSVRVGPVGQHLIVSNQIESVGSTHPERTVRGRGQRADIVVGQSVRAGEGQDRLVRVGDVESPL